MTLRIGIAGTGWFSKVHADKLTKTDGVRVAAILGTTKEKAETMAAGFDAARGYASMQDMLDGEKLDAVYLCVPPMAHGDMERQLIERGIPFLVEKPLGIDAALPKELLGRIRDKGLITSVGYHFRYRTISERLRAILAERTVGMATGGWMGGMPGVPWWRSMGGSGGQFVEQTTHLVDLLRYVAGEVDEVYAAYGSRAMHKTHENVTVPDVGSVVLKLSGGAVATISNTCLLPGDAGSVQLSFFTPEGRLDWTPSGLTAIGGGSRSDYTDAVDPYAAENEAFLHAVRTGDVSRIRSDYADAYRTQAVTAAANLSADTGQPVKVVY
ncbi:Gfo/Idh/MocA family oxidoreductase [Paenibacillus antri]|uniref:Gfo/Idh/MocA family oxidoreductase n=1 Tax=Paenibacillus antri TaxID=2582848 RepID=A0A5R9G5X4_9BACL|nr:Gfo/Idh/MocA family oxidoreductase [Paenibacillus antri]TLS49736.1 Gfo/Idh/MocA family oxidoreductase [Paenibacillus antri]